MARRQRIRLVHWKQEEVGERVARLEAEGYEVDRRVPGTSIGIREPREDPPAAFVIDLGRLPSHGREVAFALRQSKALRAVPIVFVAGAEKKLGIGEGTLWMAWPKRSSGTETDLSEDAIREVALSAGMVDTKVCAIDDTWSGLRLTRHRS
jgi:hypothetical protein